MRRALGRVKGPIILVGHSYGGTLITAAGTDARVAALVYIAALAPDESETSQSQLNKFPVTDVFSHIEVADGRIWLLHDGVVVLRRRPAGAGAEARLGDSRSADRGPVRSEDRGDAAWRSKPSWYIVARNDRTVHPDLERFAADRMRAKTYEVESSHVPMLSNPKFVLDVIRDAAKAVVA